MNWTGGRLQRSKHVANGLSAKQKQYFAAAQARLQGGSRAHSPPYVTLFEGTNRETRLLRDGHPTNVNGRENYGSQDSVVESDSIAARADRKRRPPSETTEVPAPKRRRIRQKDPSVESSRTGNEAYERNVRSRKQQQRLPETEDELQAARLEILDMMRRDDWLGPKVPQPVRMTFPSFEDKQKIGRRRKLTKADIERRNQVTRQKATPVKIKRSGSSRLRRHEPRALDHDEVSVRVGSVIHGSQRTDRSAALAPMNKNSVTSDEMLDNPIYSQEESYPPLRLDTRPVLPEEMLMHSEYSSERKPVNSMPSDNLLMESIHSEDVLIGSLNSDEMLMNSTYSFDVLHSTEQNSESQSLTPEIGERDGHSGLTAAVESGEEVEANPEGLDITVEARQGVKTDLNNDAIKIAGVLHPTLDVSIAKNETHETKTEKLDEEALWFKWVFGYDKTADEEDEVPKLSAQSCLVETAADTPQDQKEDDISSMIVEASQTPPGASTTPVSKNSSMSNQVDTSPDPLSVDPVSSRMDLCNPSSGPGRLHPRVVFKKPALFRGQRSPTSTVNIGKNIGTSPVGDNDGSGWRKSRSTRRRQSQMTFLQRSSDGEEDIED